jgi:hypothetical protein
MERKTKWKFLKNRFWKSKCLNRLKGRASDICHDYLSGAIDRSYVLHVKRLQRFKTDNEKGRVSPSRS